MYVVSPSIRRISILISVGTVLQAYINTILYNNLQIQLAERGFQGLSKAFYFMNQLPINNKLQLWFWNYVFFGNKIHDLELHAYTIKIQDIN